MATNLRSPGGLQSPLSTHFAPQLAARQLRGPDMREVALALALRRCAELLLLLCASACVGAEFALELRGSKSRRAVALPAPSCREHGRRGRV